MEQTKNHEILAHPLPRSGELAPKRLLDTARLATAQIWVESSPFDMKDVLKACGYRWNEGSDGRPRAWWTNVREDLREAELTYLQREIGGREASISCSPITAFERFSVRG